MALLLNNTTLSSILTISWLAPEKNLRWLYVYIRLLHLIFIPPLKCSIYLDYNYYIIEVSEISARDLLILGTKI